MAAKTATKPKRKPKEEDYWENGTRMIYVISVDGDDLEIEDCTTEARRTMHREDLEDWRRVKRTGGKGGG